MTRKHKKDVAYKCIDCGKPCWWENGRCHHCGAIDYWKKKHDKMPNIPDKFCVDCGKQIKYTSARCQRCARIHNCSLRVGPQNPKWKGERLFNKSGGYTTIYRPGHPRAGKYDNRVLEHIIVWEEANGKPLPWGWIIHHLNGIKSDNRLNNLKALSNKKHYLVLQAKAKRIQELEAMLNGQHQLL